MNFSQPCSGKFIRQLVLIVTTVVISACANIDFDYPREESHTLVNNDDTYLARKIRPVVARQAEGYAGFHPMADGIDSLSARLLLAARAEQSIDLQYYLIKNDVVGRALLHVLLEAADRGVRVRLLLDDIFTSGHDSGMMALDSHPNFEIRIFNPFNRGAAGRTLGAATNFRRVNRRMHNKSFTVDNQVTIIGGRNIADEYFGAREDAKFGDLDVIGVGPVVKDVADMFDTYWNHETALPLPAFAKSLDDTRATLDALRVTLDESLENSKTTRYAEAVLNRILTVVETDDQAFTWAPYSLVYDAPDKGISGKAKDAGSVLTPLVAALNGARRNVLVVSPYFVPRKSGIAAFSEMQDRGVDVTIVTNSLAANNQFTVHSGYAPARKPLLQNGVRIFEARPDIQVLGSEYVNSAGGRATLHTKAFIVDQERVFIGSFNFDPRSANINTEMGVIIDDASLATYFSQRIEEALPENAYKVFLNDKGKLRWLAVDGTAETIYEKEPQTSWWQRFKVGFVRLLPVRGQL